MFSYLKGFNQLKFIFVYGMRLTAKITFFYMDKSGANI